MLTDPKYCTRAEIKLAGNTRKIMADTLAKFGLEFIMTPKPNSLFVTHCSQTKGIADDEKVPSQFYLGARNLRFYANCERHGIRYAILSDEYGIHFDDEKLPFYDTPPNACSNERLWENGRMIREKCTRRGIENLHYIAAPPTCMVPYLIMLFASGVPFTTSTRFISPT